jgi:hypothetical protein
VKKTNPKEAARPVVDCKPEWQLNLWPRTLPAKPKPYKVIKDKQRPHVLLWPGRIEYDPAMCKIEDLIRELDNPVLVTADIHIGTGTIMSRRLGIDMLVVHTRADNETKFLHLAPSHVDQQHFLFHNLLLRSTHLYGVRGTAGLAKLKKYITKFDLKVKVKTFDPVHPGGVAVSV